MRGPSSARVQMYESFMAGGAAVVRTCNPSRVFVRDRGRSTVFRALFRGAYRYISLGAGGADPHSASEFYRTPRKQRLKGRSAIGRHVRRRRHASSPGNETAARSDRAWTTMVSHLTRCTARLATILAAPEISLPRFGGFGAAALQPPRGFVACVAARTASTRRGRPLRLR